MFWCWCDGKIPRSPTSVEFVRLPIDFMEFLSLEGRYLLIYEQSHLHALITLYLRDGSELDEYRPRVAR